MYIVDNIGSSDKTLQIVDMRAQSYKKSQLKINAHDKDVNVCDWNKRATNLIVTGSDDCTVKVWDLRMLKNN
jgi:WD40 repeat protein